jgi:hypothetical protein
MRSWWISLKADLKYFRVQSPLMGISVAAAAPAPDASLKEQLDWLGSQRLV